MGRPSDARTRLVEATIDLVWQRGADAVSVDAICELSNVKKGSFYHFFPSKDDLVVAALQAHWANRRPTLDAQFAPSVPPLERLRRYFAGILERQTQVRQKYGRVLGCFYTSVGVANAPATKIGAKVQEILGVYHDYYSAAIRDAAKAGLIQADEPEELARTLFAFMEGVMAQARIHDDLTRVTTLGKRAFGLLGVSEESSRPSPSPDGARKGEAA
jgi:TetR/AcrR family transcriptional repressor of nem operon